MISEPFEPSPFMPSVNQAFEEDFSVPANQQQRQEQDAEPSSPFPRGEKESSGRENSVAKIKVVVWHFFRPRYLIFYCLVEIQAMVIIIGELYIFTYLFQVRKRPLNKKETAKKEDDIISVSNNSLTVHETKLKVRVCGYIKR